MNICLEIEIIFLIFVFLKIISLKMGYWLLFLDTVPHNELTFTERNSTFHELPWPHGKKLIQGEAEIYLRLVWIQNLFYVAKLEQAKAFTAVETTGYCPETGAPRRFPCVMCDIYCVYFISGPFCLSIHWAIMSVNDLLLY